MGQVYLPFLICGGISLEKSLQIDFQAIFLIKQFHNDIEEYEDAQMIERFAAFSKKLGKKLMNLFNGQQSRSVAQSDPGRQPVMPVQVFLYSSISISAQQW